MPPLTSCRGRSIGSRGLARLWSHFQGGRTNETIDCRVRCGRAGLRGLGAYSAALEGAQARALEPLGRRGGDLTAIRRALYDVMWNDVGILRTPEGLARGQDALDKLSDEIARTGTIDAEPRYNLTWMDRLNLENLILVSHAICAAAIAMDSAPVQFTRVRPGDSLLATAAE